MRRGILLAVAALFLAQGFLLEGGFVPGRGPRESAASTALNVKSMHPLPDWDEPADLRPSKGSSEEDASANRFRVSLPVGLLAMLLFFLMWKFLQSQE